MTIRDVILLQQAVDEVFGSTISKVGEGHLVFGKFDPAKHPRGWHGRFVKGIDDTPDYHLPGYHQATGTPGNASQGIAPSGDYARFGPASKGGIAPRPGNHLRALLVADDPNNPQQWRARNVPTRFHPDGEIKYGQAYEQTEANAQAKFERVDKVMKKIPGLLKALRERIEHPENFDTIGDKKTVRTPDQIRDTAATVLVMAATGMRVGSGSKSTFRGMERSYGATELEVGHASIVMLPIGPQPKNPKAPRNLVKCVRFQMRVKGKATKNDNRIRIITSPDPLLVKTVEDALKRAKAERRPNSSRLFPAGSSEYWTDDMTTEIMGDVDGENVKNHDLRTSAASRHANDLVKMQRTKITKDTTQAEADQMWADIVHEVATMITDKDEVAESAYISPSVKRAWSNATKDVKPTPLTTAQAAAAAKKRATASRKSPPVQRATAKLGGTYRGSQKAPSVPKRQGGAKKGTGGRTLVTPPTTPKKKGGGPQAQASLFEKRKKILEAIDQAEWEVANGVGGQHSRTKLVNLKTQLTHINNQIGKSAPFSSEVNAVEVPIGVIDMRLVRTKKRKWKSMLDKQAFINETVVYKRFFSTKARKAHAAAGNALPNGSYPIPDKDALRRAAILARSKHGNWQAATRLIARRARELGVPNPMANG